MAGFVLIGIISVCIIGISGVLAYKGIKRTDDKNLSFILGIVSTMGVMIAIGLIAICVILVNNKKDVVEEISENDALKQSISSLEERLSEQEKKAMVNADDTNDLKAYEDAFDKSYRELDGRIQKLENSNSASEKKMEISRMILSDKSETELLRLAVARYEAKDYEGVTEVYLSDGMTKNTAALRNLGYFYAKGIYFEKDVAKAMDYCLNAYELGDEQGILEAFAICADESSQDGYAFLYEHRNDKALSDIFIAVYGSEEDFLKLSQSEKDKILKDKIMLYGEDTCSFIDGARWEDSSNHLYEMYEISSFSDPADNRTHKKYYYHHYFWTVNEPEKYGYAFIK